MNSKVKYYCGLVVSTILLCIYTALMWRYSSVVEAEPWDVIFGLLFMGAPVFLPIIALVFVKCGVKSGIIDRTWQLKEFYIDNIVCALISIVILYFMGALEIIVIQSGGDFSGIEYLLYLFGVAAVEAVAFSIGFIIQAIGCFKKKEYFQMVVLLILPAFLIDKIVLQILVGFIF